MSELLIGKRKRAFRRTLFPFCYNLAYPMQDNPVVVVVIHKVNAILISYKDSTIIVYHYFCDLSSSFCNFSFKSSKEFVPSILLISDKLFCA